MKSLKKLSPVEQEAMMKVCQEMMDSMDDMMGDKLSGAKKAKVSATIIGSDSEGESSDDSSESAFGGESDDEEVESDDEEPIFPQEESEEDLDAQIQALMAKKQASKKLKV